jgi:hypothetical protein
MDFLRAFRSGGDATASESDWKPSGEVVLGLEDLSLPGTEASPAEIPPSPEGTEPSLTNDPPSLTTTAPLPTNTEASQSSTGLTVTTTEPAPTLEDGVPTTDPERTLQDGSAGRGSVNGSIRPSYVWESPPAGPRAHSSRTAWASPARPAPAGWGHHDAWSGVRTPRPSRSGRWSPTTVAAAVIAVLALLAGGVVYVLRHQGPAYPSAWDPRVAPVASFVQSARGLTWKHPVKVSFLTPAQFEARLAAPPNRSSSGGPSDQQQIAIARAFGLIWGNVDPSALTPPAGVTTLAAAYDPSKKAVYIDGPVITPLVKAELAYSLTNALEDQHFNLRRITSGSADDESAASALVAGDADRVEEAYIRAMPAAQQAQFQQEYDEKDTAAQRVAAILPPFVAESAEFPDDFGLTLVEALYAQGGNAEVDEAFRNPPRLDGQVVDPATYQPGIPASKVGAPAVPPGATKIPSTEGFGELPLVETLGYEIGFSAAWRAAAGWTADRFVAFSFDGHTCAALSVLTDNAGDAGALASAGSAWSSHIPGATVTEAGLSVNFRTCDPGVNWRPAQGGEDSYRYLAARAGFIASFISGYHLDADGATCVADELMVRLGAQQLLSDSQLTNPNSASGQSLQAAIRQAIPECGITPSG